MNRIIKRIFVTTMAITFLFSGTVYARDTQAYNEAVTRQVSSELLPGDVRSDTNVVQSMERSSALATAMADITNEGGGVIGVTAETTMHQPVDWAYLTIYLERWYEDIQDWQIEATYEKEFWPEDEEDGELTSATLSALVYNQPSGYYYRVRAIHELEFDDGWYEVKVTRTNGILITDEP